MITRLQLNGYRLLNGFDADLRALNVIIGANATGKSTLLDFLQLTSQLMEFPIQAAVDGHGGIYSILSASAVKSELSWEIEFTRPRAGHIWDASSLEAGKRYVYQGTLGKTPIGEVLSLHEVLQNSEPYPGHHEPLKYLVGGQQRSSLYSRQKRRLVPFDEGKLSNTAEGMSEEKTSNAILPTSERQLLLAQIKFFNEFPIPAYSRLLFRSMYFYAGFDVGRTSALRIRPSDIQRDAVLAMDGSNLGSVLHEVLTRSDTHDRAVLLNDFVRAGFPEVEGLFPETSIGSPPKVLIRVRERGLTRPIELWEMSDGLLRFLCLAAALTQPTSPSIVGIDEPELGLHPRLLPIVADMIKAASETTQVIVTTHSPELLDRFSLDDVAVMGRENGAARWSRPSSRSALRKMLDEFSAEGLGSLHRSGELEAM